MKTTKKTLEVSIVQFMNQLSNPILPVLRFRRPLGV